MGQAIQAEYGKVSGGSPRPVVLEIEEDAPSVIAESHMVAAALADPRSRPLRVEIGLPPPPDIRKVLYDPSGVGMYPGADPVIEGWDIGRFTTPRPLKYRVGGNSDRLQDYPEPILLGRGLLLAVSGELHYYGPNATMDHDLQQSFPQQVEGIYDPGAVPEDNARILYGLARLTARYALELPESTGAPEVV